MSSGVCARAVAGGFRSGSAMVKGRAASAQCWKGLAEHVSNPKRMCSPRLRSELDFGQGTFARAPRLICLLAPKEIVCDVIALCEGGR